MKIMTLNGEWDGEYVIFESITNCLSDLQEKRAKLILEKIDKHKSKKVRQKLIEEFERKYGYKLASAMEEKSRVSNLHIDGLEREVKKFGSDIWINMSFVGYFLNSGYIFERYKYDNDNEGEADDEW